MRQNVSLYKVMSWISVENHPPFLLMVCCGLSTLFPHSSGFNTLPGLFSELCYRSTNVCKRYSDQNSVVSEEVITN